MQLLFDQNLSRRLVARLAVEYPGSIHVESVGLLGAADPVIWLFALTQGLIVVSKDSDLRDLALQHGPPSKVIWLRVGNDSTAKVAALLRQHLADVNSFAADPHASLIILP